VTHVTVTYKNVIITVGLALVCTAAVYAQDLEWGRAFFSKNEWHLQSTNIDPPKVRLGASHGHILGSVSGNRITLGGREVEVALMTFKLDERNRCNPDNLSGRIESGSSGNRNRLAHRRVRVGIGANAAILASASATDLPCLRCRENQIQGQ
jgi:hypothetical protein